MKPTFLQFLAEARRNPEQNPKVSINQQIDDYAGNDPEHAFISFTTVDKLGINPKSQYDTPLGIYAYPVDYVQEETEDGRWMRALPFAGKSEFATLFRSSGNIVELDTLSVLEARGYYKKLSDLWVKMSGKDWKTSVDQVEGILNDAHKLALFPDYIGGRFWYVTREVAYLIAGVRNKDKATVIWNKVFREIGVDGCVDRGIGIIHSNEPNQAVFFSINAITDQKRVYNKWSPEAIGAGEDIGGTYKQFGNTSRAVVAVMTKGGTAKEIYDLLVRGQLSPTAINHITIPGGRVELIKLKPDIVTSLNRPTVKEQVAAIVAQPDLIRILYNRGKLTDAVIVQILSNDPSPELILELRRVIVYGMKLSPVALKLVADVDLRILEYASSNQRIPRQVLAYVLSKTPIGQAPSWLIADAHTQGLI